MNQMPSFSIYREVCKQLELLDEHELYEVMHCAFSYFLYGEDKCPSSRSVQLVLIPLIEGINRNLAAYRKKVDGINSRWGKAQTKPDSNSTQLNPNSTKPDPNQTRAKPLLTDTNSIYKESKNDTEGTPTSANEVINYAKEIDASVSDAVCERFFYHYSSVGWMVSGAPVVDWRSLFRKWISNERELKGHGYQEHKTSEDDLNKLLVDLDAD